MQTGPAGLSPKQYRPRCRFGQGHTWIAHPHEELYQCADCGCMSSNWEPVREFDVIQRRRYNLVAEWLGSREDGQRTARWFFDKQTGTWYAAESWKRPNLNRPLNAQQSAYVESVVS